MKIALGELALQKQAVLKHSEKLAIQFSENEKYLIEKYGANSVINLSTGEVTEKQN